MNTFTEIVIAEKYQGIEFTASIVKYKDIKDYMESGWTPFDSKYSEKLKKELESKSGSAAKKIQSALTSDTKDVVIQIVSNEEDQDEFFILVQRDKFFWAKGVTQYNKVTQDLVFKIASSVNKI